MNETENIYKVPIQKDLVSNVQKESIAHVGDLINSIDYDAPEGTPVLAALDGVVIDVRDDSDRGGLDPSFEDDGNYIEIQHANGEVSEYEHLKQTSATVKIGERVVAGQKIAEVGNTGWSECPHLHFMVYPEGQEYKTRIIRFNHKAN